MTSTKTGTAATDRRQGLSELLVPVLLLGVGVAVLVDASGLEEGLGRSSPIGPQVIPYLYAGILFFASIGGYAANGSTVDLVLRLVFGASWASSCGATGCRCCPPSSASSSAPAPSCSCAARCRSATASTAGWPTPGSVSASTPSSRSCCSCRCC